MENVPELEKRGAAVLEEFRRTLERLDYKVACDVVQCADYGAPQTRRRLVLLASRLGPIEIPKGTFRPSRWRTVRKAIGDLPEVEAGEQHPEDPLHTAAQLSPMNLKRVKATPRDGGSHAAWPKKLMLACHLRETGERYRSIYGRMWWDKPAPTMTTLCNGIGNGRFGHPEQDRALTLREAAIIQTFPKGYEFWPVDQRLPTKAVARMIGNAVPPRLAEALGRALLEHVRQYDASK